MGQRILVIRMDHLGDVMLTTPLTRALAVAGHEVQVILPAAFVPVFEHSPRVKAVWGMETICPDFPQSWRPLARWIRQQKFDVLLLPYALQRELLWASFFSGVKTRIAMWAGLWGRLTLHRCLSSRILQEPRYFADIVLDCARAMQIPLQGIEPELFLTGEEVFNAQSSLKQRFGGRPVIGIHPGCAGNACNLPPQTYAQMAEAILEQSDCALVITGSGKERELLKTWPEQLLASPRVWNSMGELSLRQLAAVIHHFSAYLCPSTGPLHLASALRVPTVSPFCAFKSLSPVTWGNQQPNAVALTPAVEFCQDRRKADHQHCDFCGQIAVTSLVQAALRAASGSR
jgi:ADP-heptose:LPS heptosyltransferase